MKNETSRTGRGLAQFWHSFASWYQNFSFISAQVPWMVCICPEKIRGVPKKCTDGSLRLELGTVFVNTVEIIMRLLNLFIQRVISVLEWSYGFFLILASLQKPVVIVLGRYRSVKESFGFWEKLTFQKSYDRYRKPPSLRSHFFW